MGVEVAIAGLALGAISGVKSGIDARRESKTQAQAIMEETQTAMDLKEGEVTRFMGDQQVAFTKSGVDLSQSGTAMDILESTRAEGDRQIAEIKKQGQAQASSVKRRGRQALFGSVAGAVSNSLVGGFNLFKAQGGS